MNYYNNSDFKYSTNDGFSYKTMILTTVIIVVCVLAIWYIYANNYRYSDERICDKLRKKYNKKITDTQVMVIKDGRINEDKTVASATITIQSKDIASIVSSVETLSLPVMSCAPNDNTCVEL
jgi:hypothetical protein